MNIEKIEEIIIPILARHKLELYSLKRKREFGMSILEVLVDGEKIDAQMLGEVNKVLNDAIDEYLPANFYLEVSTAGAIRPLKSIEQVKRQIGKYVLVKIEHQNIKGVLENVEDDSLFIKVNEKGRIRTVEVLYSEAREVILTVKF